MANEKGKQRVMRAKPIYLATNAHRNLSPSWLKRLDKDLAQPGVYLTISDPAAEKGSKYRVNVRISKVRHHRRNSYPHGSAFRFWGVLYFKGIPKAKVLCEYDMYLHRGSLTWLKTL